MTQTHTPVPVTTSNETCSCEEPLPVQRAERKGAATTVCSRCGLGVPARLR